MKSWKDITQQLLMADQGVLETLFGGGLSSGRVEPMIRVSSSIPRTVTLSQTKAMTHGRITYVQCTQQRLTGEDNHINLMANIFVENFIVSIIHTYI